MRMLQEVLKPETFSLPVDDYTDDLISEVQAELTQKAALNPDRCMGYFPALAHDEAIENNLPACAELASSLDQIEMPQGTLGFNFLRLSLTQQPPMSAFHLDTDAATALTGNIETVQERKVWRALLNLSSELVRRVTYVDVNPFTFQLSKHKGSLQCDAGVIEPATIKTVSLPKRSKGQLHGLVFCANRVLHSGADGPNGHFVAGYGAEY